tara:strand:- start:20124 stop:20384 length:261 start_codon:yes stop_codon:yes gene_type:complete
VKIIVKIEQKGWFKGLGLHHASITLAAIIIGHILGFGAFMAIFFMGWYASREYGNGPKPPATFEILDFLSPAVISVGYLTLTKGII